MFVITLIKHLTNEKVMKTYKSLIILIMISLPLIGLGQVNPKYIKTVTGKKIEVKQLDELIHKTMDSLKIPGVSIAIINNAKTVYYNTFGVKNVASKDKVNDSTLFEGASLSKPLFSYFFLKMVDKGLISLDMPLYKYMPHPNIKDNDERYKLITARMVLSHRTGFANWSKGIPIEMAFTPGTDFSYSGEAHQWLTALLATHMKTNWQAGLDSIFQQEVAVPLGMKHTYYVRNEFTRQNKATGYFKDGRVKEGWESGSISFGAAHTVHSEAMDYAKFLVAMIKGEGLKKETYNDMLKEQTHFTSENGGKHLLPYGQTGWCLGFAMKPMPYGVRYMHTGVNSGFQSYCSFNREKKYGIVLFTNSEKAFELYDKLGKYLDDEF